MTRLDLPRSPLMREPEIEAFRDSVSRFFSRHVPAERSAAWRAAGQVEIGFWKEAAEAGLLGVSIPAEHGGGGGDFRHDIVIFEEVVRHDVSGFYVTGHNGVVTPYVLKHGTEAQKRRWLPRLCSGDLRAAIAMSEPGTGSDVQQIRTSAVRDGDGYRINGAKTFISNGQGGNFIVVAAKTDPSAGARGVSLLIVETDDAPGFRRGRKLKKIGQDAADTSEMFFDDVWVPSDNLLGGIEGQGFRQMMTELPRERLVISTVALANTELALETTIDYTRSRKAFGHPILDFQNTQFRLAELKTEATLARVFLNHCIEQQFADALDNATAAMSKLYTTELLGRTVDQCLQLHGGYGYVEDYPIARLYRDARVCRVYGGSSEIMKIIIARTL